jgi:hypothetical protein
MMRRVFLTIDTGGGLTIAAERSMLGGTWRRVEAWRALDMSGYTLRWTVLRRRRGKTRAALSGSASHDTLEEIGGAVTDGRRRRMRRAGMRRLTGTSTSLEIAAQARDVFFVPV